MARRKTCSDEQIPVVRLALEKERCLRRGDILLRTAEEVAWYIHKHYGCSPQEFFLSLALNARNEVLNLQEVGLGGLSTTMVDPRVLFSGAILSGADAVIMIHNHPSGNAEPSQVDIQMTKQLVAGGRLLGIRVLDHIVIARGLPLSFTSFLQRGLMPDAGMNGFGDEEMSYDTLDEFEDIVPPIPLRKRR